MSENTLGPVEELRRRIGERGPITFDEFMAVALYWPHGGYYVGRGAFGPSGDFYTAPLTHPVFGALIARQVWQMWMALGQPTPFWVIEPGAGSGRLAMDLTAHVEKLDPRLAHALRYVAVDQQGRPGMGVRWVRSNGLPFRGVTGVILANELLDALPVHRVVMEGGRLREVYVDVADQAPPASSTPRLGPPVPLFREVLGELSTPALAERLKSLGVALPEGYRTEICLGLEPWLAAAAAALDAGYLLLVDYGHEAADYYGPGRERGMLRCYYQHTVSGDPYVRVGKQDIGAHVEFTSVRRAAEKAGFREVGFVTQAAFLESLGLAQYRRSIEQRPDISPAVRMANLSALDILVDPEGMGSFKVLGLSKGAQPTSLAGFGGDASGLPSAEAPLATSAHMPMGVAKPSPSLPTWDDLLR